VRTGVRRVKVSATPSLSRYKHQRTGSNPICRREALWTRPGRGCSVGWRPNDDRSGGTVAPIGAGGDAGWTLDGCCAGVEASPGCSPACSLQTSATRMFGCQIQYVECHKQ
jgi:hypothetical protein